MSLEDAKALLESKALKPEDFDEPSTSLPSLGAHHPARLPTCPPNLQLACPPALLAS